MIADILLLWIDLSFMGHAYMVTFDWYGVAILIIFKYGLLANNRWLLALICVHGMNHAVKEFKMTSEGIAILARRLIIYSLTAVYCLM